MFDISKLTGPVKAFVELLKSGFGMSDAQIEAIGEHNLTEQARLVAGELHKSATIVTETGDPPATPATEVKAEDVPTSEKPAGLQNAPSDGDVPVGTAAVPVRDLLKATETNVLAKLDEVLVTFNALDARIKTLEEAFPNLTVTALEGVAALKAEVDAQMQTLKVGMGEAKRAADAYQQLTTALPTLLGARGTVKPSPAMKAAVDNIQTEIDGDEPVFTGAFRMRPQIGN